MLNGFEPIINTATQPLVLVANPAVGVKTLPDLIKLAKGGKQVTYASPGAGSPMHIAGEWLNKSAGVNFTHVPYKGVGPSVTDVVAGHVDTAWVTFGAVRAYLENGRLIPLAIGDAQRSKLAPNVPTLVELGYKEASRTIFEANMTHAISGFIMLFLGSGPVKGFAVVLLIGIATSVFTAVTFTRMLVVLWVRRTRPSDINI